MFAAESLFIRMWHNHVKRNFHSRMVRIDHSFCLRGLPVAAAKTKAPWTH
jgi:hypothetical protein